MRTTRSDLREYEGILAREEAELLHLLRNRDGIAVERSADQLDEIQCTCERDLAIRNAARESILLADVRAALGRIRDGSFGTCIECEWAINPKRLRAVPWAARCIACQDAFDRDGQESAEPARELLVHAA